MFGQAPAIANPGRGDPRTSAGQSEPRPAGAPGCSAPTATVREAAAKAGPYPRGQQRSGVSCLSASSVATTVSATYEHPAQPGEPGYARWRTDIRVDYRITPPLLRSELLDDATLGSFRPFHGFQRSNVPVPPDIAAALSERAAPRLVTLPRPGEGGHRPGWRSGQAAPISDRASAGPTTRPCRSPPTSSRPDCSSPPAFTGSKPAVRINRSTSPPARSSPVT